MTLADSIIYGTREDVEIALKENIDVDVNDFDEYGYTPLIEAVIFNKTDIATLLLAHKAQPNQPDLTGRTPLHWAVDNSSLVMTKLLLDQKANPNAYTKGGQPVLTFPLLRRQEELKDLLYRYGADLNFAQDFINSKLVGHRFELEGQVHIVDTNGQFILLDYEGFFLEFTLVIIENSLHRFKSNYAAKKLQPYFKKILKMLDCLRVASELIKYQHYNIEYKQFDTRINRLLEHELILIPVAYEGHAITCIKCGDLWVKCDRGYNSRVEGSVVIYRVRNHELLTRNFIKNLIYKKHSREYVNQGINEYLGLLPIAELPLPPQVIGNCSWANVEASVPAMLFLLLLQERFRIDAQETANIQQSVMAIFEEWREWDKDRALEECIQSFNHASPARKASKAALLAAVLVQKCHYDVPRELHRAEKILPLLAIPEYQYILQSYIKVYIDNNKTEDGENLLHLLDMAAPKEVGSLLKHKPIENES